MYIYIYMVPPHPYRISLPISLLSGAPCIFWVYEHSYIYYNINARRVPRKTSKNKPKKPKKTRKQKTEDYYTVTSHIVLRFVLFCFFWLFWFVFVFLFFFCFLALLAFLFFFFVCVCVCFCFLVSLVFAGFLVFRQGGHCKGKSSIFCHVRKHSEAIGNFDIFRNRICRSPRRGLVRNQFESSSCSGLHTNTFN